ncbi:2-phospho-L-lactate guanylyltransferase [Marisediminicola sp. LYQ134]|uniref:2-phospho-L-lactate guanylyltransferase n=1 Tax=Marisediminicola sp. LYQ134 TaxID=3391061 RepID=UPI0039837A40
MRWSVVIPVKRLPEAKSRLRGDAGAGRGGGAGGGAAPASPAPDSPVADLALAFALDTVSAARESPGVDRVLVVSSDATVAREVTAIGGVVVADPGGGLNAAVGGGVAAALAVAPEAGVAVLTGDLPSLLPADLGAALAAAALHPRAVVPDHLGTGTTLLTARPGESLDPRFGVDSRSRHENAGHEVLDIALGSSVRWDVDTPADLDRAAQHGTGRHTARALAERTGAHAARHRPRD